MATYTGDALDKLHKQDLIPIVLSLQSKLEYTGGESFKCLWKTWL